MYDGDGLKVAAFEVEHGDLVKPEFRYRIDYGGRSAVISGDNRFNDTLIKYAGAGHTVRYQP